MSFMLVDILVPGTVCGHHLVLSCPQYNTFLSLPVILPRWSRRLFIHGSTDASSGLFWGGDEIGGLGDVNRMLLEVVHLFWLKLPREAKACLSFFFLSFFFLISYRTNVIGFFVGFFFFLGGEGLYSS